MRRIIQRGIGLTVALAVAIQASARGGTAQPLRCIEIVVTGESIRGRAIDVAGRTRHEFILRL